MLQKLPTPQGEAKGLDTIDKTAQLKFRRKGAPKCMNASSPSQMHFSHFFSQFFLDAKLPLGS
jgi:hypothetical protein